MWSSSIQPLCGSTAPTFDQNWEHPSNVMHLFFITAEPAITCRTISDWNQRSYLWSPSGRKKIPERDSNMLNLASNIRYVSLSLTASNVVNWNKYTLSAILCNCSYSVECKWLCGAVYPKLTDVWNPKTVQSSSYIQPCTYCTASDRVWSTNQR